MKHGNGSESNAEGSAGGAIAVVLMMAVVAQILTGCMQITGAKKIDAWGLVIEANNGFDVSAGVQQYDRVENRKGIGAVQKQQ